MKQVKFNFGKNWLQYSQRALDEQKFVRAKDSLVNLLGKDYLKGKSFLDIGCGSGIFSLSAKQLGAEQVLGFDVSEESITAAKLNAKKFSAEGVVFSQDSLLNKNILSLGKFDIAYSWGVLHHTGKMWESIDIASKLVAEGGLLVIAIYNKHWTSPLWKKIKLCYNLSPDFIQKMLVGAFYGVILLAKMVVTRKNPFKLKRGMTFYHNVIDWLGGYPYEYATIEEVVSFLQKQDFTPLKTIKAPVPTGCNEFVFKK